MVHSIITRKSQQILDFFFIQIGGKDGKSRDPIYKYVTQYGWRGIVVEPTKFWFQKLSETYADYPQIQLENSAIAEKSGKKTFYQVNPKNWYLRLIGGSLSSLSKTTLVKHAWRPGLSRNVISEKVACLSFKNFLEKYNVKKIDLLVTDTEGYDYKILKQIDFSSFRPSMIFYEHKHMSPEEKEECRSLLEKQEYTLERQGRNTFAYTNFISP